HYGRGYRPRKVFEGHFEQRAAVNISMTDRVEGDIQAAHLPGDGCGVSFHLVFVQRIDLGHLCDAAQGRDFAGDLVQCGTSSTSQEDAGSVAGESTGDRRADCTAGPIDHRVLVLEKHFILRVDHD